MRAVYQQIYSTMPVFISKNINRNDHINMAIFWVNLYWQVACGNYYHSHQNHYRFNCYRLFSLGTSGAGIFYMPDALPVSQPTVSKNGRKLKAPIPTVT